VVPVFNEGPTIAQFLERLYAAVVQITPDLELVVVNDGSTDNSAEEIQRVASTLPVHYIEFSRNFGKECAMQAGLDSVCGDCAIILDADFQHPVESIAQMVERWKSGVDMVYTVKAGRESESLLKRVGTYAFYRLLLPKRGMQIPPNAGDFRLLDHRLVEELRNLPERTRFMKGLYAWVGFKSEALEYRPAQRQGGATKFNTVSLTNLAVTGITAFSTIPLRAVVFAGFLISMCAMLMTCWIIFEYLFLGQPVAGFATLAAAIFFFSGIQLIAIGVVGEYVGRIFDEVKRRPLYVVAEEVNQSPLTRRTVSAANSWTVSSHVS
jgi:glycosyltransferase involved in cell wall biosynthesis